jgi:Flp pilus assembly protein protease CpaA
MAAAGVGFAATGVSRISLASSTMGLVIALVMMLPGHVFGGTGAGDVKFFAAAGALLGAGRVLPAFLFMAIAGGVFAVGIASHKHFSARRDCSDATQTLERPSNRQPRTTGFLTARPLRSEASSRH